MLLAAEALTPNAIAGHFDMTRQAVSNHIRILTECEVLTHETQGRERIYHLNPDKFMEVEKWLQRFRARWETRFAQLDRVLEDMEASEKKDNT